MTCRGFCALDKKLEYSYNSNGNITSITSSKADGTSATTKALVYDTTYPDRLTSFDGWAIGYNTYGYLTSYRGWTYSWSNGRLSSISRGTLQTGRYRYSFSYNGLGQRIQKMYSYIQGTGAIQPVGAQLVYSKTDYTYDNAGRLIKERRVDQFSDSAGDSLEEIREFRYLYDTNSIIGMVYTSNGTTNTYYFDKNLQGDVIGIYDTSGNLKAKYSYDAFGNCTITNSTIYDLAKNNPIRYRGYYYDTNTELYYLNARYYNPELRRFISPDDTSYIDPETPNGLNLYCYCNNDPVNYADPSGHLAISTFLIGLAISSIVGWGLSTAFGNQVAGGIGTTVNGITAISTGIGLLSFGPIGWIAGGVLLLAGFGTIAFGVNEIAMGITGTNYISEWTGMSVDTYNYVNLGLNVVSGIGSILGNAYMRYANINASSVPGTTGKPLSRYSLLNENGLKQTRFYDLSGNAGYDVDYRHGGNGMTFPHYHYWKNGMRGKEHLAFQKLIYYILFGG